MLYFNRNKIIFYLLNNDYKNEVNCFANMDLTVKDGSGDRLPGQSKDALSSSRV